MISDEFQDQVRDLVDRILNRLQTANLLTAQVSTQAQTEILEAGKLVQSLSLLIEDYLVQQRTEPDN